MKLLVNEDKIRAQVSKRSQSEIDRIKLRRRISAVLSGVILIFGWTIIYLGTIYESET